MQYGKESETTDQKAICGFFAKFVVDMYRLQKNMSFMKSDIKRALHTHVAATQLWLHSRVVRRLEKRDPAQPLLPRKRGR